MSFEQLFTAASEGDIERMKTLFAQGADPFSKDPNGSSLLIYAAVKDRTEMVEWLVEEKHLDVNDANDDGGTALLSATKRGFSMLVRWLVEHGANVYDRYKNGLTAVELAKKNGFHDLMRYLMSQQQLKDALNLLTARTAYEEKRYAEAIKLLCPLVQRNNVEAKKLMDDFIKTPNLVECQVFIPLVYHSLKQDPDNRDFQFLYAEAYTKFALLTPCYEHAKLACKTAYQNYAHILRNNPADSAAEIGLTRVAQIKKSLKQHNQDEKVERSKELQLVQQRSQSPQSHSDPRLYRSPTRRPLSPTLSSAARLTHSPLPPARKVSPQQLAEIGKANKNIKKFTGSQ